MKRRTFLASALLGSAMFQAGCKQPADPSAKPPMFSALMGADEFTALGQTLLIQLGGPASIRAAWNKIDDPDQQIASDFRDGHIIVSQGWVLSQTEALHCALFTLSNPAHAR